MVKYFDEEWPKEEEILKIGLEQSKQNKKDRQKVKNKTRCLLVNFDFQDRSCLS